MKHSVLTTLLLSMSNSALADSVELLHWWTSKGERQALAELEAAVESQGLPFESTPVYGGGGDTAMTVLQARAIAGNPPEIALIEGPGIQSWATLGFVTDLHDVATAQNWSARFPDIATSINSYNGHFVAAPVNIHRVNWLWANKAIFDKYGLTPPGSWDEFFTVADTLKNHGMPALSIGNEPWQLAMLFEVLALGLYGSDYYRDLLIRFEDSLVTNQKTVDLFKTFRRLKPYMTDIQKPISWDQATLNVANGLAAMQLQGDWVKGELTAMGHLPNQDYYCLPAPGTANTFVYNVDSFVLFRMRTEESVSMANRLAETLVSAEFQSKFNQKKGSIPILNDVDMTPFDSCSKASKQQFHFAEENNTLLPSMSDSMAIAPQLQEPMLQLINHYFNDDTYTEEEAIAQFLKIAASVHFSG
ncbi:ABC transporter substrate-binding protein [Enterovibrio sp. ZSDZ35]|uniref:Probable sugar-binding periplasmic protein n=1 Tax=Enterovibrio qingdaonensis TaxID=2899818 RepID=A0ABT5QQ59_9GAMM|nr:ABC transporter substrate-binding protein [Enterovibrio sp. ZSDZ35]MDD1783130.1 ABC transporter substrate-binding protein [Enterovibrio sp. ZSDZ35]